MAIARVAVLPEAIKDVDFSFDIGSVVLEPFDSVPLHVEPRSPGRKSYEWESNLFEASGTADRAIFLAREGEELAGYIVASRGWNGCAIIDDFAVARHFRRRGLASALMGQAVNWAHGPGLKAMRSESQTNNVAAFRFYLEYGF